MLMIGSCCHRYCSLWLLKWPRVKQLAVLQDCNIVFVSYHFSGLLLYAVHPCRSYRTLYQPNSIILNWDYWDHLRLDLKLLSMMFPWKIVLFVIQSYWGQLTSIQRPPSEECCRCNTIIMDHKDSARFVGIPAERLHRNQSHAHRLLFVFPCFPHCRRNIYMFEEVCLQHE